MAAFAIRARDLVKNRDVGERDPYNMKLGVNEVGQLLKRDSYILKRERTLLVTAQK